MAGSEPKHPLGDTVANVFGRYVVPPAYAGRPVAKALTRGEVYEPLTLGYLSGIAGAGIGDVVTGGCFIGDFLPGLAKGARPGVRIWAFEPVRLSYSCAVWVVENNSLPNVTISHVAVSERAGESFMRTVAEDGRHLGGSAHLVQQDGPAANPTASGVGEMVTVTTIDSLVPEDRHVAVLHLDVEGHEESALRGALKTIKRCRPTLVLEGRHTRDTIGTAVADVRYRPVIGFENNVVLMPE